MKLWTSRTTGAGLAVASTAALVLGTSSLSVVKQAYGYGLFVGVPFFVGFFPVAIYRLWGPRPVESCMALAFTSGVTVCTSFLLLGIEGVICIIVAVPLVSPLALLGGVAAYLLLHRRRLLSPGAGATSVLVLLAGLFTWEFTAERRAPVYVVTDTVEVPAPPDEVWEAVLDLGELPPPRDWLLRTGVACPVRTELKGRGVGADRICTLSTGELRERITAWEPGRRLGWIALSTPPPLKEENPFWDIDPPHLHGFYTSLTGEFELEAAGTGTTLLTRRSAYQHHLYPAAYWRLWCDLFARRGHRYVLNHVRETARRK